MLEKAKVPAAAAGAALIGVAGGIAASRGGGKSRSSLLPKNGFPSMGGNKKSGLAGALPRAGKGIAKALPSPGSGGSKLPRPDLKGALKKVNLPTPDGSVIDWVEENAKNLGDAGYKVAEVTSDARKVRKALDGEGDG